MGIFDKDGVERLNKQFPYKEYFGWGAPPQEAPNLDLPESLEDGEYQIKLAYSLDEGAHYDQPVFDYSGKEAYVKMIVRNDTAYLSDCFLYNTYSLESLEVPRGVTIDQPFTVTVKMSYNRPWGPADSPVGNVYLSILKDGHVVTNSELYEVMIPVNTEVTYEMQITAPEEWGVYELVLNDESGNQMMRIGQWMDSEDVMVTFFVLPICEELLEDFEAMPTSNSTSAQNVQGNFTTWSFNKSGVRAPGEGKCNGAHAVMMKLPSTISSTQPLSRNFFMAQATFFNPTAVDSKYKLEYSLDGGSTWNIANTMYNLEAVEVESKGQVLATWTLDLTADQPALFRIAMIGGGNGTTYVDDIVLYYTDQLAGDVNGDGEVNIADVNVIIDMILKGINESKGDVNGDGEVNIADVNAIIAIILS